MKFGKALLIPLVAVSFGIAASYFLQDTGNMWTRALGAGVAAAAGAALAMFVVRRWL